MELTRDQRLAVQWALTQQLWALVKLRDEADGQIKDYAESDLVALTEGMEKLGLLGG